MKEDRPLALTQLSEDEVLLQNTVLDFAKQKIAPLVHDMDEKQLMDGGLISSLFELGRIHI